MIHPRRPGPVAAQGSECPACGRPAGGRGMFSCRGAGPARGPAEMPRLLPAGRHRVAQRRSGMSTLLCRPALRVFPPFSGLRRSSEAVRHEHTWRNLAPSPRHVPRPRRFPSWDTAPHRQTSKLEVAGAEARPHERASASRRVLAFQAPAVLLCGQGNSARGFRQQLCTRGE